MRAAVVRAYGPPEVIQIEEMERPVPQDDQVLVRVHAVSVNPADFYGMSGLWLARLGGGLLRPKDTRFALDFAGVVEAAGKEKSQFKPGDAVFGAVSGACAELVCVRNMVFHKPANLTFEQAAAIPTAAVTALQGLCDHGNLQAGQRVLVNGAAGGVGTFAIQIARALGAQVDGVCSTQNVELVRSLGAGRVFDYTREDFTRSGQQYDLLLDVSGTRAWRDYRRVLKPQARHVIIGAPKSNGIIGPLSYILRTRLAALGASQKVTFFIANFRREDFATLIELCEAGKVIPFVERTYPLEQVAAAMRYLATGHARGKLVVTLQQAG